MDVLILVLMEDTLGDDGNYTLGETKFVLILVLMEDTLGAIVTSVVTIDYPMS